MGPPESLPSPACLKADEGHCCCALSPHRPRAAADVSFPLEGLIEAIWTMLDNQRRDLFLYIAVYVAGISFPINMAPDKCSLRNDGGSLEILTVVTMFCRSGGVVTDISVS